MSLTTITIDGNDFISYASVAEADVALSVDPTRKAAWDLITDEAKGVNLVAATQRLDSLPWRGSKAGGASQANAFPRTGLTYEDGSAVADDIAPYNLEYATILLAGSITSDITHSSQGTPLPAGIRRVKAGSAEVEFATGLVARPVGGTQSLLQDQDALALVQQWLISKPGAAVSSSGAQAFGTDGESFFSNREPYGRTEGYN